MTELAVDYGIEIPVSWVVATIQDVAEMSPKLVNSDLDGERSVHFVPMAAISENFGGIDTSQLRPLQEVRKGYTYFSEGDVLFAKITPCMENGKGAIVPALEHEIAFGSTEFHVLRCHDAVSSKWLAYYISQPDFRHVARQNMTGTAGQLRVPSRWLGAAGLPVPPRAEQTRIVEKLEELLSHLDAGVAELKAAQRKLAQYRQSLLKAAVEGTLTADWRAQHTPQETGAQLLQRILIERRSRWEDKQRAKFAAQGKAPPKGWQAKYPEPVSPDTTDLPNLPAGWVWAGFDQVFGALSDGGKKIPQSNYLESGDFPVVDQGSNYIGGYTNDQSMLFEGPLPVIVFGDHTRRFKMIQTPFAVGADGVKLVGISEAWNPQFALMVFQALHFEDRGYSRHFQFVRNSVFPLPSLIEQIEIAERFHDQLDSQQGLADATSLGLKQAAAQRKALLRAAFAGQLVPQDPNDEPASALLARIRAERQVQGKAPTAKRGRRTKGAKA